MATYDEILLRFPLTAKWSVTQTGGAGADLLIGSDAAERFVGNGGADTMIGGGGDDTYTATQVTRIVETAGGGIDTVQTWSPYVRLPDHIENLSVHGNSSEEVYGNDLNNRIQGNDADNRIDGRGGDDLIVTGGGNDTVFVRAGCGNDIVADFAAGAAGTDVIHFQGLPFRSFDAVRAAMAEQDGNVVVTLGNGETLTLANHRIADFDASDFTFARSVSDYRLTPTFQEEFNALSLWNGSTGIWYADTRSGRGLISDQASYYVDPADPTDPAGNYNPFRIEAGQLSIEAVHAGVHAGTAAIEGRTYLSGMVTTQHSFSQTYGYFEMRAALPEGKGIWPAFWMRPVAPGWPPELDIMEMLGDQPSRVHMTLHTRETGTRTNDTRLIDIEDSPTGYHTYGAAWTPTEVVWFVDGIERGAARTPDDMHGPMYLLANLGVGGNWPGLPDASTVLPSQMMVDYIRAYRFDTGAPAPVPPAPAEPVSGGGNGGGGGGAGGEGGGNNATAATTPTVIRQANTDGDDRIAGTAAADRVEAGFGNDTVEAGDGDDLVLGNQGADLLFGNRGLDTLFGGQDDDVVFGGQDADVLYGQMANDGVFGNLGDDVLFGGQGADTLHGGQGDDRLYGNLGDDRLAGGQGSDVLDGGAGADLYILQLLGGIDRVVGFDRSEGDAIGVSPGVRWSVTELEDTATIVLDDGSRMILEGVHAADVTDAWFVVA